MLDTVYKKQKFREVYQCQEEEISHYQNRSIYKKRRTWSYKKGENLQNGNGKKINRTMHICRVFSL